MFTTLKIKLIIAAIILAIAGGGFLYVKHLNHSVDTLKQEKTELSIQSNAATDTINEAARRDDAVDEISNMVDQKRKENEVVYQTKIVKVDKNVQEGKDKPVGPLLNSFFNDGL